MLNSSRFKSPLNVVLSLLLFAALSGLGALLHAQAMLDKLTREHVAQAEKLIGLSFSPAKIDSMLDGLEEQRRFYDDLRAVPLQNSDGLALYFNPLPLGVSISATQKPLKFSPLGKVDLPKNFEDLAFYSVRELSELIRTRKLTSEALTRLYLSRLKRYADTLRCVVTLTEDLALAQARRADQEIARGKYRGPLHGIPYGIKDLFAVPNYPTTFGSRLYQNQVIDCTATVARKLEDAGAVLLAKLSLGELARGDVWFGGITKNPHNLQQGSSGSSAGSAAATAAGLVAFSIGTETLGSIVSPSTRCGVTGLRPTFGRVSRHGAMTLCWSMDKVGPICRTVEDCAIVFNAIYGPDGYDLSVHNVPFNYDYNVNLKALRIGYYKSAFDSLRPNKAIDDSVLTVLRALGVELIPIELPHLSIHALRLILTAESSAAFEHISRTGQDDSLVLQGKNSWANSFRVGRFATAVEYLHANRVRALLISEMHRIMSQVDVFVTPSFGGTQLTLTNFTGHPCVTLPNGFTAQRTPTSITFVGKLFDEGTLLAVARQYQAVTAFHKVYPQLPPL